MKKLLALVLALVMTLGLATVANAADFADQTEVDASKYSTAIQVLTGMGVFKGYGEDNTFRPDAKITRAQVAAMIYRIYTGDVDDKQIVNYVNLGNFSDVKSTDWYAGYVGYCANAKFIKGYGDGTFQPNREISGYEALAMILRAVGYNAQNDFEGADYWVKVAEVAEQYKMLDKIAADDLTGKAPRATIAQILFDAINVPTVNWLPALGYQNRTAASIANNGDLNETLGWKNFKLTKSGYEDTDDWGRMAYYYYKEADTREWNGTVKATHTHTSADGKIYATFAVEPTKTYNTAVAQCDVAHDVNFTGTKNFEVWLNGNVVADVDDTTALAAYGVSATATAAMLGAQGRLTEVYYNYGGTNRIVMIDTFLARVTSVTARQFDRNQHLSMPALLNLEVFSANTPAPAGRTDITMTKTDADWTYAAGDYLLMYLKTNEADAAVTAGTAAIAVAGDTIATHRTGGTANRAQTAADIAANGYGSAFTASAATNNTPFDLRTALRTADGKGAVTGYAVNIVNVPVAAEILGAPKTVEGAQKTWLYNQDKVDIGGTEYNQAFEFHLDYGNRVGRTEVLVWMLDNYGNVIGDIEKSRDDYAVLKDIIWIQGTPGHAQATLVYMDGKEESVTVASMDGFVFGNTVGTRGWRSTPFTNGAGTTTRPDNAQPIIADAAFVDTQNAHVSTDSIRNGNFLGLALYRVRTLDSGAVQLDAWVDNSTPANGVWNGGVDAQLVVYPHTLAGTPGIFGGVARLATAGGVAQRVSIDKTAKAITFDNTTNAGTANDALILLNNDTQFIVRSGNAVTGYTYTSYTGTANLPDFARNSLEVFYTTNTAGNIATRVYIKSSTLAGTTGVHHMFIPVGVSSQWTQNVATGLITVRNVVVDGEVRDITIANVNAAILDTILANEGKLMHVMLDPTIGAATYGTITAIDLCNELTDATYGDGADDELNLADCDYISTTAGNNNVVTLTSGTMTNNAAGTAGYNIDSAKIYVNGSAVDGGGNAWTAASLEAWINGQRTLGLWNNYGVWVEYNDAVATPFKPASAVYVGTRLRNTAALTVTTTDTVNAAATTATYAANAAYTLATGGNQASDNSAAIAADGTNLGGTYTINLKPAAAAVGNYTWMANNNARAFTMDATLDAANGDVGAAYITAGGTNTVLATAADFLGADDGAALVTGTTTHNATKAVVTLLCEDGVTQVTYLIDVAAAAAAYLLAGTIDGGSGTAAAWTSPANNGTTNLGDVATPMVGDTLTNAADDTALFAATTAAARNTAATALEAQIATVTPGTAYAATAGAGVDGAARRVGLLTFAGGAGDNVVFTVSNVTAGATYKIGYGVTLQAALVDMATAAHGNTVTMDNTTAMSGGWVVVRVLSDTGVITYYTFKMGTGTI